MRGLSVLWLDKQRACLLLIVPIFWLDIGGTSNQRSLQAEPREAEQQEKKQEGTTTTTADVNELDSDTGDEGVEKRITVEEQNKIQHLN